MRGIGSKIKKIREFKNFTQKYVAEQLGVTQSHYSRFENEVLIISEDHLQKLCKIFEMSIEEFLDLLNSTNKCNFWSKKIIFFKEREKENILSPLYPDGEILFLSLSFLKKLQNETSHQRAKIRNKCNENKKLFTQRNSRSYW